MMVHRLANIKCTALCSHFQTLPNVIMRMHHNLWTAKNEVCVPLVPFVNLFGTRSSVVFDPRIYNLDSYMSSIRPLFSDTTTTVTTITVTWLQVQAILWQLFYIAFFRVWVSDVCSVYACHIRMFCCDIFLTTFTGYLCCLLYTVCELCPSPLFKCACKKLQNFLNFNIVLLVFSWEDGKCYTIKLYKVKLSIMAQKLRVASHLYKSGIISDILYRRKFQNTL